MKTVYIHSYEAWHQFPEIICALVRETGERRIAEVGAGANPTLSLVLLSKGGSSIDGIPPGRELHH